MKFLSLIAFAGVAFACAEEQKTYNSKDVQELGELFGKFEMMAADAKGEKRKDACLLNLFGGDKKSFVCPLGLESVNGECFEPCQDGFKPLHQFCVPTSLVANSPLMPYKREATAVHAALAFADCPAALPFRCGFVCTKDNTKCTELTTSVVQLLITLITKLQSGDYLGVAFAAKDIYDFASAFPPCEQAAVAEIVTEYFRITV
ncbi:hypothetical protein MP638_005862 [Amoeboaphelidium occidentale]|nr:hypothetical protein MP638_005862 [Amoeboaphelidium occidentale]